jgi:hypothetical protein
MSYLKIIGQMKRLSSTGSKLKEDRYTKLRLFKMFLPPINTVW